MRDPKIRYTLELLASSESGRRARRRLPTTQIPSSSTAADATVANGEDNFSASTTVVIGRQKARHRAHI